MVELAVSVVLGVALGVGVRAAKQQKSHKVGLGTQLEQT